MDAAERAAALDAEGRDASGCERCGSPTSARRSSSARVRPTRELMLVGEAPGFHEDRRASPFAGRRARAPRAAARGRRARARDVYVATVLKCRPPGQPRSAARGDRGLRAAPLPADRARPARASSRRSGTSPPRSSRASALGITRVHGAGARGDARSRRRPPLPALPPGRSPLHAVDARGARAATSPGSRSCSAARGARAGPAARSSPSAVACRARARQAPRARAARALLSRACRASARRRPRPPRPRRSRARSPAGSSRETSSLVSGELGAGQDDVRARRLPGARRRASRVTSPTFTIGHRYRGRRSTSRTSTSTASAALAAAEWGDLEPYFDDAVVVRRVARGRRGALPEPRARASPRARRPDDAGASSVDAASPRC